MKYDEVMEGTSVPNERRVVLCLDDEEFNQKPDLVYGPGRAYELLSRRIALRRRRVTVAEFAHATGLHGRTWTQGVYRGEYRRNSDFLAQQVFAIDIDTGLTIEEGLQRCRVYNIEPAFAYTSFSHTDEHHRFRLVFVLPVPVRQYRTRRATQTLLMSLFDECDSRCSDAARLFNGGNRIVFEDYAAVLDIPRLVNAAVLRIYETHSQKNVRRALARFSRKVGVDMENGVPWIRVMSPDDWIAFDHGLYDIGENGYEDRCEILSIGDENILFRFGSSATRQYSEMDRSYDPIENVETDHHERPAPIEHVDWENLEQDSELFRRFMSGTEKFDDKIVFGLATNLVNMKGGRKKFFEALERCGAYDIGKWQSRFQFISNHAYKPQSYSNFYPQAEEQEASTNLVNTARHVYGNIVQIRQRHLISRDHGQALLRQHYQTALEAKDTKIYLIKGPTGLGKTHVYTMHLDEPLLIVVPTHRLKDEVVSRVASNGRTIVSSPELPALSSESRTIVQRLYKIGAHGLVNKYLSELRESNGQIDDYLVRLDEFYNERDCSVTTHERALWMPDDPRTVVIDEDILASLIRINETSYDDLLQLLYDLQKSPTIGHADRDAIAALHDQVVDAPYNVVQPLPETFWVDPNSLVQQIVVAAVRLGLAESNLAGLLTAQSFIKTKLPRGATVVKYMSKHGLPEQRKHIILSATASEELYHRAFGDRLVVLHVGDVEPEGRVIQYPYRSYSRTSIKNAPWLMNVAKEIAGRRSVITFKDLVEEFQEDQVEATFGALAGLDHLKGQDIVIVGTPHVSPHTHALYATALGYEPVPEDFAGFNNRLIERGEYRFWMKTYAPETLLHEIHMHMVESELQQAVGRARIIWHKATVTLLSNVPIPGAEFVDREEWRLLRDRHAEAESRSVLKST